MNTFPDSDGKSVSSRLRVVSGEREVELLQQAGMFKRVAPATVSISAACTVSKLAGRERKETSDGCHSASQPDKEGFFFFYQYK